MISQQANFQTMSNENYYSSEIYRQSPDTCSSDGLGSSYLSNSPTHSNNSSMISPAFNSTPYVRSYSIPQYNYSDSGDSNYYSRLNSTSSILSSDAESSISKPKVDSLKYFSIEAILAKPANISKSPVESIKSSKRGKKRGSITEAPHKGESKRLRTIFTQEQLDTLEVEFEKQQYMVGSERTYLAKSLGLTESQVKIWFQNRRIKWRKTSDTSKVDESIIDNVSQAVNQSYEEYDD